MRWISLAPRIVAKWIAWRLTVPRPSRVHHAGPDEEPLLPRGVAVVPDVRCRVVDVSQMEQRPLRLCVRPAGLACQAEAGLGHASVDVLGQRVVVPVPEVRLRLDRQEVVEAEVGHAAVERDDHVVPLVEALVVGHRLAPTDRSRRAASGRLRGAPRARRSVAAAAPGGRTPRVSARRRLARRSRGRRWPVGCAGTWAGGRVAGVATSAEVLGHRDSGRNGDGEAIVAPSGVAAPHGQADHRTTDDGGRRPHRHPVAACESPARQ